LLVLQTALYNKLCGVELSLTQALVREMANDLHPTTTKGSLRFESVTYPGGKSK